jgi:hypothetical protein
MKKERICKSGRKIKYKSAGLTAEGHHFVTTRQEMLNFLNRYEKTDSIVDQRNVDLLPINYRSLGSC